MPHIIGFRSLIPSVGGNVQAGSGMRREQAVAEIKGDVIEVGEVGVTRPVPADKISRRQTAQGKHFGGITRTDQAGVDQTSGSGFTIGWRHPAGYRQTATALAGLFANATGNEMRAIITQAAGGSRRQRGKSPVAGTVRPKITITIHITAVVVGIGNRPGPVILVIFGRTVPA